MRLKSLSLPAALLAAGFLLIGCGFGMRPTVTPVPTPTTIPTPTPIPDSDGDGLIDTRELELGTNPFHRDSDTDGLDDGQELQVGTDPLFADTDRDGVVDGDDVLPLADARVRVSILQFTDRTQRGFLHGDTNAYFTVFVRGVKPVTTLVYSDVQHQRIAPVVINIPDDLPTVRVGILAQEHAPLSNALPGALAGLVTMSVLGVPIPFEQRDEPYDISQTGGTGAGAKVLLIDVPASEFVEVTGSGTGDGNRLRATVLVKVEPGGY